MPQAFRALGGVHLSTGRLKTTGQAQLEKRPQRAQIREGFAHAAATRGVAPVSNQPKAGMEAWKHPGALDNESSREVADILGK